MISDAIYELQFFQMISILKFVNFDVYNVILQNFFKSINKYAFLDWFLIPNSKITSVTSIKEIKSEGFSILNEILLFFILFIIGIVCSIIFGVVRLLKFDTAQAENEEINEKEDNGEFKINEMQKDHDNGEKIDMHKNNGDNQEDLDGNIPQKDQEEIKNNNNSIDKDIIDNENNDNQLAGDKKDITDFLKNNKSNISNHKLINTEGASNEPDKSQIMLNKLNNNDLSNVNVLSPEFNSKQQPNKKFERGIREAKHKSINYSPNKSKKNQLYLEKQDYIFTRFTYSSIRNYFFYSYFIRVYQLTLVRLVITYSVVTSINGKNKTSNFSGGEVFFISFLFYVWVILLPLVVLTYLRNHQNDLLSRKQIIRFGSLYLSYRGISKDIYAILMQVKFIAVPYVCILYGDVGDFIYYICGFIFVYYMFFVTISKPFSKVWKVFNESLSFLILIIFCFSFVIMRQIDSDYKIAIYSYYTYLSLIISLLVIRSFRIFIDTTKRVLEIMKMRMPKERDFKLKEEAENNFQLDIVSVKLKEKVDEMENKAEAANMQMFNNKIKNIIDKDEELNAIKEFEYDENAEYNVENMSDEEDEEAKEQKSANAKSNNRNSKNKFANIKNIEENENNGYAENNNISQNRRNFFEENKQGLNSNTNNTEVNNNLQKKLMIKNTNPNESKVEFQLNIRSGAQQSQIHSQSHYSSENSRKNKSSRENTEISKQINNQYGGENHNHFDDNYNHNQIQSQDYYYNSESNYSRTKDYSENHFANKSNNFENRDRRSSYIQESNDYSAEADSQRNPNASKLSSFNSQNNQSKQTKKNLNFSASNKYNTSHLNKKLTKIQEETNSHIPETSEIIQGEINFSGRSNNSRAELNSEKSIDNERDRIMPLDDRSEGDGARDRNAFENNNILDAVNRDLSAEKKEILKKFRVKKNKKKNDF